MLDAIDYATHDTKLQPLTVLEDYVKTIAE